jgi:hypothetical protein
MSRKEFQDWLEFYNREPFDDRERYHRPAALVAHSMGGAKIGELLKWLAHDLPPAPIDIEGEEEIVPGQLSAADRATIASLGIRPPKAKTAPAAKGK